MQIIINVVGLVLVGLIIYWFWIKQTKAKKVQGDIVIKVDHGVYEPSVIEIPADKAFTLQFLRKTDSGCASVVQFKTLDLSATLPLNETVALNLPPLKKGEYNFACQMGMYRGKVITQ